jgi:carboxypeptidase T
MLFSLVGGNFQGNNTPEKTLSEIYSKVKIHADSREDISLLQQFDIDVEHYQGNFKTGIELVLNENELSRLNNSGLSYEILIPDMKRYYEQRQPPTEQDLLDSKNIMETDNVSGFSLGSMGGFYTYAEMIQQLDSMRLLYSAIITQKINIGTSQEGRTIWAVKISDNPESNESATEPGVHFDALHHAREPMSLQAMMYFMYWLLENYGSNPEATYLVNNREIFFIPVVNPDGYEYNRSTDPNGGGQWRKNRRNNGGSFGVDLNRNYSYGWGHNSGSSGTPSSGTYRGPSAFSEPESRAVRDYVLANTPEIGFSVHSVAGRYLNPYGYTDTSIAYEMYADFTSEFTPENGYLYGTVSEMLEYYSSGTTRDYLHASGTYCWTPELGGSSFWPNIPEIVPLCSENLYSFKYLSWVSGAYSRMQNYKITGAGHVSRNDTLRLELIIRNKGLTKPSNNVNVTLSTTYPNVTSVVPAVNFGNIAARNSASNTSAPFKFFVNSSASVGDEIKFICSVTQEGVETSKDTVSVIVGKANILFSDDAENGTSNWTKNGTGSLTDTSFVSYWAGNKSFADSRYGNSMNSSANYFTMSNNVSLSSTVNPRLEFNAKWALEDGFDYTRIQISTNNGSSWTTLTGKFTSIVSGQQSYDGIKYWVKERISLQSYIGQNVKFRFYNFTDNGVPGDGFYFDNFRIVDYRDTLTSITGNTSEVPDRYSLGQNYPNPFNPSTSIKFDIPRQSFVKIAVYDALGRQVETLVNTDISPGRYSVDWNASAFPSGVYFYRIYAGQFTEIRKMILMK